MLDALPSIAFITSAEGATLYANRHYQAYTGLSAEELAAGDWMHLIPPEDRERTAASWREALRDGEPVEVEYRLRGADGVERWFKGRAAPHRDAGGTILNWLGTLIDIHDLKTAEAAARSAEAALSESEERLRLAAEAAQIGTWDHDLITGMGSWDEAARRILGLPPDGLSYDGATWIGIVHPDDREQVSAAFQASLELAGPRYDVEFRSVVPAEDGGPRWLTSHGAVFRDPLTKAATRAVGIVRDITHRRRREERLAESEAQLRLGLNAGRMVTWSYDLDTGDIRRSENADEIFGPGVTPETFFQRMPPEDAAADQARLAATIEGRAGHYDNEFRYNHPDGRLLWLQTYGHAVRDEGGRARRLHGVCVDITARKEAELALQQSEEQFKTLADRVPNMVWFANPSGEVRYLNQRWYEFTGQTQEEALPRGWTKALHPDDALRTVARWEEALAQGETYEVETRYRRRDGTYRWYVVRAEPLRDAGGIISAWFGTSTDIHDRKLAEEALRRLNEDLEQRVAERTEERDRIWRQARDLMCVARTDGTLLSVNPAWEAALGWSVDWLTGRSAAEIKHPGDAERTAAELAKLAKGLPSFGFEDRYRHKDGSWRWISWTMQPEGGLIYCVGRDVTIEKETRAALEAAELARREADALYRAYFENTPEALFVIGVEADGTFTVEQVNPAHEAGVGFRLEDIRGRRVDDVLPAEIAGRVIAAYRQVIRTGEICQYREVFELGGGPQHWDTSLVPVRNADGRVVRLIGSSRNVTRQVVAEEALRQSQKMEAMGQLTGGVAHDFNNLLTPIVAVLDRLRRQDLGGEREQRLIAGAAQSAERAKTLVQRLLAFARRQPLQTKAVSVSELIGGMADLVASTIGPQIRVVVDAPDDLPPAKADPHQLEMALLNLAVNARDAMPEGGTLRIVATAETVGQRGKAGLKPGAYIRLSVADTGAGMDEATLARAVEPFFSTKGVGKGTGLGLSMVHGLASQLGGGLIIQSRPRLGTNVELWLPQSGTAADKAIPNEVVGLPLNGAGTVLLVDDDDAVRLSTADMLNELGYSVVEAGSAEEAGELLNEGPRIDLLVTDHLMPGMTGTDLARWVRARWPDLPVLVISGYAESEGIELDLPRLTKPFRKDELAASLAILARRTATD